MAHHFAPALARRADDDAAAALEAPSATAYLAYNQITPFLRFAHMTANQAILDAASGGARRLHIVDLDAAHGVQWPPLLQTIADCVNPDGGPPEVRITGAGADCDVVLRTGDRLRAFASSLNLPFHFHPLLLPCTAQLAADPVAGLELHPDKTPARERGVPGGRGVGGEGDPGGEQRAQPGFHRRGEHRSPPGREEPARGRRRGLGLERRCVPL